MPVVLRTFVIHVVLVATTNKRVKRLNLLLAKIVMQVNTKTKLEKHRANRIVLLVLPLTMLNLPVLPSGSRNADFQNLN